MTKSSSRIVVAVSAIALAASVAAFAAQESTSKDLLPLKQVQELVTNAKTPAEHTKLQKHFLALAAKYEADAAEHAGLAKTYLKPPVGRLPPGSAELRAKHCDQMTLSLTHAAKEARELAAEHGKMTTAR